MTRWIWWAGIPALLAVLVIAILQSLVARSQDPAGQDPAGGAAEPEAAATQAQERQPSPGPARTARHRSSVDAQEVFGIADFSEATTATRLQIVSDVMGRRDLHREECAFLMRVVKDVGEDHTVRNNALYALMRQSSTDFPTLASDLVSMAQDDREDEAWREFSVQYLGEIARRDPAGAAPVVRDHLTQLFTYPHDGIAATALHQYALSYPDASEGADDGFAERCLRILQDDTASRRRVMAVLGAVQVTGMREALVAVRQLACDDSDPTIQRSAIAVIGHLGRSELDADHLERSASSADRLVAMAAQAALGRLQARDY